VGRGVGYEFAWDIGVGLQVPTDAARLTLATNMDERCEILKGTGAKFYKSLDEYEGGAYLRAWQTKWEGEVEPLEQTWEK
jgi:hypothetical protein